MNNIKETILSHVKSHPLLQPCDAVKLLYQNEFGCGHMVSSPEASYSNLCREWERLPSFPVPPLDSRLEDIGNGFARLSLSALEPFSLTLENINRMFVNSAAQKGGNLQSFQKKLDLLRALADQDALPFSRSELAQYLDEYQQKGYPAVHHSSIYRDAYHPAYRVILSQYGLLLPVIGAVNQLLRQKPFVTIALDGPAASGKTTAAQLLSKLYDTSIIHMDDFFLPQDLRTERRYQEPGGNVHYERFQQEVLPGIAQHVPFSYRVFDCKIGGYAGCAEIPPRPLTIVEGSYSLHPAFGEPYDLTVFCSVSPQEQLARIQARNGPEMAERFQQQWIPLETVYFQECRVAERCAIRLGQAF